MKKIFILGMTVLILSLGVISCGDDEKDPYKLSWGLWEGDTYSDISGKFTTGGAPLTSAGTDAGYLTGASASTAYQVITTQHKFDSDGTETGTYEGLLNFKKDGIGAPQELKTAMLAQKNNVPVGGVFEVVSYGVIVFYVEKN